MRLLLIMLVICLAIFLINEYIWKSKKSPIAEANTNFLGKIKGELFLGKIKGELHFYKAILSKRMLGIMTKD